MGHALFALFYLIYNYSIPMVNIVYILLQIVSYFFLAFRCYLTYLCKNLKQCRTSTHTLGLYSCFTHVSMSQYMFMWNMTIFDLIINNGELVEIQRRDDGNPLPTKDEKIARKFIEKYWKGIVDKWVNYFVLQKRIRCTDIKTKIK